MTFASPPDKHAFIARLKLARAKMGLSQQELGEKSGTSRGMIYQYEAGKRNPRKKAILNIAKALDVDAEWLEHGIEVQVEDPPQSQENEEDLSYKKIEIFLPNQLVDKLERLTDQRGNSVAQEAAIRLRESIATIGSSGESIEQASRIGFNHGITTMMANMAIQMSLEEKKAFIESQYEIIASDRLRATAKLNTLLHYRSLEKKEESRKIINDIIAINTEK